MKELNTKHKIALCIIIVIMLAGIIVLCVAGFNKNTFYKAGSKIEVYIPQGYQRQDIITIAKECFPNREIEFEEVEKLEQVASIRLKSYTAEELDNYKTKVAEKYEIDKDSLEIEEVALPKVKIASLVKPYVVPLWIITVLAFVYVFIRNIKSEEKWKVLFKMLLSLVVTLGVYFSILVIARIPFGSYTMPMALAIYLITLIVSAKVKK